MIPLKEFGISNLHKLEGYDVDPGSRYGKGGFRLTYIKDFFAKNGWDIIGPTFKFTGREMTIYSIEVSVVHTGGGLLQKNELSIMIKVFAKDCTIIPPDKNKSYPNKEITIWYSDFRRGEYTISEVPKYILPVVSAMNDNLYNHDKPLLGDHSYEGLKIHYEYYP